MVRGDKERRDITPTQLMREIYACLVNLDNELCPRTQAETSRMLDRRRSVISDNVKKLLELGYISELPNNGMDILYRPGKNREYIERHIKADIRANGMMYDDYGRAIVPRGRGEQARADLLTPYRPVYRSHLNGGWMQFTAVLEGKLDVIPGSVDGSRYKEVHNGEKTPRDLIGKPIPQALFGNVKARENNGSLHWNGSVCYTPLPEPVYLPIWYQKTKSGKKFFYITPEEVSHTFPQAEAYKDSLEPYMRSVRPVLKWMEKYGGWRFRKNEYGDYECLSEVREGPDGLTKEYGTDAFMTDLLHDYLGPHGIPGKTPYWFDTSPKARGPNGEFEFNKLDYARAVDRLPEIEAMADASYRHIVMERERFLNLMVEFGRMRDDLNSLAEILIGMARGNIPDVTRSVMDEGQEVRP